MHRFLQLMVCLCCLVTAMAVSLADNPDSRFRLGVGLGLDYGGLGVKVDAPAISNCVLTAGLGITAPNVGVKFIPPQDVKSSTRFYGALRAGITHSMLVSYSYSDYDYYNGEDMGSTNHTTFTMYPGWAIGLGIRGSNFEAEAGYAPVSSRLRQDIDNLNNLTDSSDSAATKLFTIPIYLSFGFDF